MKNNFALWVTGGLAAAMLFTSFAFTQDQDQKKTRHVKLTKIDNGKTMHLDTMLSGDDVFIWNGDTINPEKHIRPFSPSGFDQLHNTDRMDRQRRTKIYKGGAGRDMDRLMLQSDSGEDFHIFTEEGDSAQKRIMIHKRLRDGSGENHMIFLDESAGRPVPGIPPVPHIRQFRGKNSAKGINLNDPNVISYKKKDIGQGRERIEIIRKKSTETENFDFDFEMDHLMPAPPAPPAPPVVDEELMKKEQKKMEKEMQKIEKQQQKAQQKKDSVEEQ